MKQLTIDEKTAIRIYPGADDIMKAILEESFGKSFFTPQKITDRIKSLEDACRLLDLDPLELIDPSDDADVQAYKKLKVIAKALNEGWTPDWNNSNQYKWYPWFYFNQPGFRVDAADYGRTDSRCGSRLCFKTEELALYAANTFLEEYKAYMTI